MTVNGSATRDTARTFDYLLIGGGLQSGLLAHAINHFQPNATVAMLERDGRLAGNHTWSFHLGDLAGSITAWMGPLIEYRWPAYDVLLEGFSRQVTLPYASISSSHFARSVERLFAARSAGGETRQFASAGARADAVTANRTSRGRSAADSPNDWHQAGDRDRADSVGRGWELHTATEVTQFDAGHAETRCGKRFVARQVIDCRGPGATAHRFQGCGFQKFHGFEVEFADGAGIARPRIMDGRVAQDDGFRFFYVLPFTPRRLLIEETRFSDRPELSRETCLAEVRRYLADQGIGRYEIVREETGVLPMPYSSERLPSAHVPLSGGYAGGWFHAATGYSLPLAAAFAEAVAAVPPEQAHEAIERLAERHRWQAGFGRLLNRLLFRLVAPRHRHQIFRRFYRVLPEEAIARFYAHRFRPRDAARLIIGAPPTLVGLRPGRFLRSYL